MMVKRYELSDEVWAVVADLFTESHGRGRPHLMLDGVLWVLCSGAAGRDMPERFGPWSTVYQRYRGWRNQGTFDQMLTPLLQRSSQARTESGMKLNPIAPLAPSGIGDVAESRVPCRPQESTRLLIR